jgi:hypothetical protein
VFVVLGEFATADATLRQHVAALAAQQDAELADDKLRERCRKSLVSLHEHWSGLTLFVDDPRIPSRSWEIRPCPRLGPRRCAKPSTPSANIYVAAWHGLGSDPV